MWQCYSSFLTSLYHVLRLATVRLYSHIFAAPIHSHFFSQSLSTRQIPPFWSAPYVFCPTDVQFPSDCAEAHVHHTWRAIQADVCLSLFATCCFHNAFCVVQSSLVSEFCCKSGSPSWAPWHLKEAPCRWWFQISVCIWTLSVKVYPPFIMYHVHISTLRCVPFLKVLWHTRSCIFLFILLPL